MLPFTSLNAVTVDGVGSVLDLQGSFRAHTLMTFTTGTPSGGFVRLQGSHDGVNFVQIATVSVSSLPTQVTTVTAVMRYVRAELQGFTGGTSPTLTATIASSL